MQFNTSERRRYGNRIAKTFKSSSRKFRYKIYLFFNGFRLGENMKSILIAVLVDLILGDPYSFPHPLN